MMMRCATDSCPLIGTVFGRRTNATISAGRPDRSGATCSTAFTALFVACHHHQQLPDPLRGGTTTVRHFGSSLVRRSDGVGHLRQQDRAVDQILEAELLQRDGHVAAGRICLSCTAVQSKALATRSRT
jgi:hypothetical protein